ncbi:ATP-binding cassette domain-containing protein [Actinokineospora sp.]|uniref:ATP-binding cassette domain-containing protein n=1 Tax=Actinokineospora sp. TaxID=1872133 RepID=UPI004037FE41
MQQKPITIVRARENNLKDVSLEIPRGRITVFTGVSGSGKSSLVFDTIAAESQRQLNETFTAFVRTMLPKYGEPNVDSISNLSTAVVIDQKRLGGGSRSTLGTISDIAPLLRLLFSRFGSPHVGGAGAFSFNDPAGMCERCDGIGKTAELDLGKFLDPGKSLRGGAILFPPFAVDTWYWKLYAQSGLFDLDTPLADYGDAEMEQLLHGKGGKIEWSGAGGSGSSEYEGLVDKFTRLFIKKDVNTMAEKNRETVMRFVSYAVCSRCQGSRLNQAALGVEVHGYSIAQLSAMQLSDLLPILTGIADPAAAPVLASLTTRLRHLVDIGLGYLSLDRETMTLSGGESQRVKTVRHLSSSLIEVMYVFDEPSVGLHARDVARLNDLLRELRDKGNTVLVVEHDPDVIAVADHIVDIGPHAGARGGQIVYQGSLADLRQADTLTGRCLRRQEKGKTDYRSPTGRLTITDAVANNLKKVTVDIPTGVLTAVTGVAGAGKSSLVIQAFQEQHPDAIMINQAAVTASSRSTPATYIGIMDEIRKAFGKANKVSAALFSFNSKGACATCQGLGFTQTDLAFLDPVKTTCEDCAGKRFRAEVLAHTLRGKSISDVLALGALEAVDFFAGAKFAPILDAMVEVGLDYITLGQPLSTLSGGECQRLKLACELHKKGSVYIMDEPTSGLHMSDIDRLVAIMDRLVDQSNTVVVIEHNLDVVKNADWVIELGPGAGRDGGQVVFEGTPRALAAADGIATAAYLRPLM